MESRLTFLYRIDGVFSYYECLCGNKKKIRHYFVNHNKIKSCGCLQKEVVSIIKIKDNIKKHPLYGIWHQMKARCYNIKNISYKNYGAKGVTVCDEWRNDFLSFYNWAIENGWQKGLQIDKDKKANALGINPIIYSPQYCSIVSRTDNNNAKKSTIIIEYDGYKMSIKEWELKLGFTKGRLYKRIYISGYSIKDAITLPIKSKKNVTCK